MNPLSGLVFENILALWGPFDLFARLNFKVAKYDAWKPHTGATFINAILLNWEHHYFYVFPPFSHIATCLQKIEQDRASGVLLVPLWKTQPWFTLLLHLLVDKPRLFPQSNTLLVQHPQQGFSSSEKTNKTDCMQRLRETIHQRDISGKAGEIMLRSWSRGQTNNMHSTSRDGQFFVINENLVPLIPL